MKDEHFTLEELNNSNLEEKEKNEEEEEEDSSDMHGKNYLTSKKREELSLVFDRLKKELDEKNVLLKKYMKNTFQK